MSPVTTSASLATAPRSPTESSETGICSFPLKVKGAWIRSSEWVLTLTRFSSGLTRPERTLNKLILPTWRSTTVFQTQASGGPSGSGGTSVKPPPASTVTGGRSMGEGPISQMNVASRSTAICLDADPHTTGNT